MKLTIGLLCDSFPPLVDGVAQVVLNYAKEIERGLGHCFVVTPAVPGAKDDYAFPVLRLPAVASPLPFDYRVGVPFWPSTLRRLYNTQMDLMHVHSPFVTMTLARLVRRRKKVPIIFTYHTKFMYEFEKYLKVKPLQSLARRYVLDNINAADEVWAVSRGAAEDLKALGYVGGYMVMENGSDFSADMATPEGIQAVNSRFGLTENEPVLLFVGRMMWYKNIGKTLEALVALKDKGQAFRMIFAGDGVERADIEEHAKKLGLGDRVFFPGMIRNRAELAAYYTRADLFVFPSVYDNASIAVQEAMACACPCLLVEGSSTAEGVEEGLTGFLVSDTAEGIADGIERALSDPTRLRRVGQNAKNRMFLPWEKIMEKVWARYETVCRLHTERRTRRKKMEQTR